LERSLGGRIVANRLRGAGFRVEVHDDHFADDAPDEEWLNAIAGREWILLTKDGRIRRRVLEKQALQRAGVHAFFLGNRRLGGIEMADAYERAIPAMIRLVMSANKPILASVHRDGRVTIIEGFE
jgi:hypothetical protein